ncbi:MAG: heterodisulfide reductase [Chloroflexi bacterium]|nr:heterodisulfide reductase [Chloroflexota bacterium]
MQYAFFPGCVSRGGCPELYPSVLAVADKLNIELVELTGASCTGAGALQESNPLLGDTLNARTFAMAEKLGLPIMTICSTCQGVMSQAIVKLRNLEYRAKINEILAEEGLEYTGSVSVKHMLWIIVEDIGLETLKTHVVNPLTDLYLAPFYGCYIVRPSAALDYEENPLRKESLELVIEAIGATSVDFSGKTRCCGFPILTINEKASLAMVGKHTLEAQDQGADAMVTPCPLCHLNLDGFQSKAAKQIGQQINLPILHLPQAIGMAMGLDSGQMLMGRHLVPTYDVAMKAGVKL